MRHENSKFLRNASYDWTVKCLHCTNSIQLCFLTMHDCSIWSLTYWRCHRSCNLYASLVTPPTYNEFWLNRCTVREYSWLTAVLFEWVLFCWLLTVVCWNIKLSFIINDACLRLQMCWGPVRDCLNSNAFITEVT